jgi:ribosome-binding factor A
VTQRTRRIDELLRQEIGALLAKEVQDPRIGFVTVTDVETDPDLRHARVWVSVIAPHKERDETIAALNRAMVFIRRELGTRLRLKRIPELHVRLDETAERGTRVLQLLHELEQGNVPDDSPPADESLPTPVPRLPRADESEDPPPFDDGDRRKPDDARGGRHSRGRARRNVAPHRRPRR